MKLPDNRPALTKEAVEELLDYMFAMQPCHRTLVVHIPELLTFQDVRAWWARNALTIVANSPPHWHDVFIHYARAFGYQTKTQMYSCSKLIIIEVTPGLVGSEVIAGG